MVRQALSPRTAANSWALSPSRSASSRAVENACKTSGSAQPLAGIRAEPIAVQSDSSCLSRISEAGKDATSSSPLAKWAAASRLADRVIAR